MEVKQAKTFAQTYLQRAATKKALKKIKLEEKKKALVYYEERAGFRFIGFRKALLLGQLEMWMEVAKKEGFNPVKILNGTNPFKLTTKQLTGLLSTVKIKTEVGEVL